MNEKKIVMIIDDDVDDRFFFKSAIEKLNELNTCYECYEAQHGVEALEFLRSADPLPDFIFLDLNMPLMDGRECLVKLKEDVRLKHIPVIIYTTSIYEEDIRLTKKFGAIGYMTKPCDIFTLPGEILKVMKKTVETIVP